MESFFTGNYLLSFGGPRNDVLMAMTNEHPTILKKILLVYLKNIDTSSTIAPRASTSSATSYWIGDLGLYFVEGLMNNPINPFQAYLFTTDKNVASGTFGVFKMDFSTTIPKYIYTALTMASGLPFSVTSLTRTSQTDANDFIFAGKAKSLTDGTNIQTFATSYGYVMKAKTSDSNINCFSFLIGYSLSLANTCTINFVPLGIGIGGYDNSGIALATTVT